MLKKKALALFLVLIMAIGCLPTVSFAATKYITTTIPKTFPIVKQDPSFTLVTFWYSLSGQNAVSIANIVNWYNSVEGKKTKSYVKAIYQGAYDDITIKLQATLQANNRKDLPDLVQLSPQGFFPLKESPYLTSIGDLIKADKTFTTLDKLDKGAIYACSYNGKQMGMPFSNSVIILHYNATAFKAVGLDPDSPPKTVAEYAQAAVKLMIKGTGSKPVRYGGNNKLAAFPLNTWVSRQKDGTAHQFDMEDGRLGLPTKYAAAYDGTLKATLTEWGKALQSGAVNYTSNSVTDIEIGSSCMYQESLIYFETIQNYLSTLKDKSKIFENRMAPLPVVNTNDTTAEATAGSAVYMLNKGDAVKQQKTYQFVKFLASVDVSAYWYIQSGYFPMNRDAISTKYVQDVLTKYPAKKVPLQIREDSQKYYKFQAPLIPSAAVYDAAIGDQCALLGAKKITVDQAVENIRKKAEAILANYRKANSNK